MCTSTATEDLSHGSSSGISTLLLGIQAWLAAKASARRLYRLDDRALSDLALSRSDVERVNATVRWPAADTLQ
jgi:uncharacterized protein YjiS (DUF1127 family)